jgi:phenylacetate-coenzyme A ligase PaaK-like adenylate-forming protein
MENLEPRLLDALPERFEEQHLTPDKLAPLFRFELEFPGSFPVFYDRVQDLLLDFTIHNAYKNTKFYRRSYGNLSKDAFMDREKLQDLPLIFRHDVEGAQDDICSQAVDYAFSSYTSGTTSDNPLILSRSKQEQDFVREFHTHILGESTGKIRLALTLAGMSHGHVFQLPTRGAYTFPLSLSSESRLKQAVKLLSRSWRIQGEDRFISCLSGPVVNISKLTAYCLHRGVKEVNAHIDTIQTSGDFLSDYHAKWLGDYRNCQISNAFSMSELFLTAPRCKHCGLFHFNRFGIIEVLETHSNKRINTGRGRLFVTGLYPFTQMTPLIRYSTGDLVETKETGCPHGKTGYRFLGRENSSLIFKHHDPGCSFLSGGEIYNALDEIPDINRPKTGDLPGYCERIGVKPIFWCDNQPSNVIHIELRYFPSLYPNRLDDLENIIKKNLIAQCSQLANMFKEKTISLQFHPPDKNRKDTFFRP